MAQLLFQVADDQPESLSRARSFYSIDEAQEHLALDDGRRPDHPPWAGILRLGHSQLDLRRARSAAADCALCLFREIIWLDFCYFGRKRPQGQTFLNGGFAPCWQA